jgi:hypothetical protein
MRAILLFMVLNLFISSSSWCYIRKTSEMSKKEQDKLSQVIPLKVSLDYLESYFNKNHNYNIKDSYSVTVICKKVYKNKRVCNIKNFEIFVKKSRGLARKK